MKNVSIVLLHFFFLLSIGLFNGCSESESTGPDEEIAIGQLVINPSSLIVNTSTEVSVRLVVSAGIQLVDSTAKLVRLGANDAVAEELGLLLDNGDLYNGDEIIGDNVYSTIISLSQANAGELRLKVVARAVQGNNRVNGSSAVSAIRVYSDFTSDEFTQLMDIQQEAYTQFSGFLGGNAGNIQSAITQTTAWLAAREGVESAVSSGTSAIEIKYSSGVYGGLIFAQEDETGSVVTRGGILIDQPRKKRSIPLKYQTRGTVDEDLVKSSSLNKIADLDPTVIGNRNVMIFAPFEAAFSPWNEGQKVVNILNSSDFKFQITYLSNQDATVSALSNLTDYGLVILATHGSGGNSFGTGEIIDTNETAYQNQYKAMLKGEKLAMWKNIVVRNNGTVSVREDVYAVRSPFISGLPGTFPNSVILNNSCQSTMSADLQNAFIGKGAKTYFGYSQIVSSRFCVDNADSLVRRLAKELKNTGESFIAGNDPHSAHNAAFELKGGSDIHYTDELINGDFEYGKIDGWTKDGDGRVISRLGGVNPTQPNFMGIISTGLGYTEATGSIFQTFTVDNNQSTLTIKWNFLSEEFLEFINSSFMDYFTITIRSADGSETVLFSKNIDGFAADFGATYEMPGSLISVSPGIVFDVGGVYMTGWQTSTFNVSSFRNQRITLILSAGDIGDSIYDSAILLDEISVQ